MKRNDPSSHTTQKVMENNLPQMKDIAQRARSVTQNFYNTTEKVRDFFWVFRYDSSDTPLAEQRVTLYTNGFRKETQGNH